MSVENVMPRGILFSFLWVASLCFATAMVLEFSWRYDVVENNLLEIHGGKGVIQRWDRAEQGVALQQFDGQRVTCLGPAAGNSIPFTSVTVAKPVALTHLGVSADLSANSLIAGVEAWQRGYLGVWSFDEDGQFVWYWPHEIAVIEGNQEWDDYSLVVPLADKVSALRVIAYNGATAGLFCTRSLRITGLIERPSFVILRYSLWLFWIITLFGVARRVVQSHGSLLLKASVLAFGTMLLVLLLMPQPHFAALSKPLEAEASRIWSSAGGGEILSDNGAKPSEYSSSKVENAPHSGGATEEQEELSQAARSYRNEISKIVSPEFLAHALAFCLITGLSTLAFEQVGLFWLLASWLLAVFASEAMQLMVITRESQWSDLLADICGVVVGCGLGGLVRVAGRLGWFQIKAGTPAP